MLTTSKLSMIDESGVRRQIIPAEVKGRFRRRRNWVHFFLLIFFLALPWIRIRGSQAVLLDIPNRHFELFGQVFMAHDSPLLFFLIALTVLSITVTTALWGRVWCGWACPQTVFLDSVYRRIEIWVEGTYIERRKRAEAPMTGSKFGIYSIKWFLFFAVSSLFAHSFIAYFSGSERLVGMMTGSPAENWNYFLIVSAATALLMFNFGWFREQFCIIMCPYGRFQNVLMDEKSFSIVYDEKRGEPRKGLSPESKDRGDCVSCNRCVQVCPTGIDIRNGLQMECIGCTACADACDEIMAKVHKPAGLISYRQSVPGSSKDFFRPRILVYMALIIVCIAGLGFNIALRKAFSIAVLRGTDVPYQVSSDGSVINHFKVNLHNQAHEKQIFEIYSEDPAIKLVQSAERHEVSPGESKEVHVFLSFPAAKLDKRGRIDLTFQLRELQSGDKRQIAVPAVGPIP